MKNNIIFLDCTQNYSYQFSASNTKIEFIARGLVETGDICTIFNGIIGTKIIKHTEKKHIKQIGDIITYPQIGHKLVSFIFNIKKLYKDLRAFYKDDYKNFVILACPDYHIYLIYTIIAKIIGYKIVVISHEWGPTITTTHPMRKPFIWIYSKTFGYFADGILPISEFIIKKIRHFNKPFLKVPILADYNQKLSLKPSKNNYFLYCVYAAYSRVIFKIIDAYKKYISDGGDYLLVLVLSGSKEQISYIESYINKDVILNKKIIVRNKVPYTELLNLYSNAHGLIIPLDPSSEQDEARFSQKIAEYLSSGSPIISNNVGEIKYYFTDKENIILCEYGIQGFADAFKWISENVELSKRIGINGFNLGKKEFNYAIYGKKIHDFFENI